MQLLTKSELESQHEQIASNVSLVQSYAHSKLEKRNMVNREITYNCWFLYTFSLSHHTGITYIVTIIPLTTPIKFKDINCHYSTNSINSINMRRTLYNLLIALKSINSLKSKKYYHCISYVVLQYLRHNVGNT